jgi:hypothetical protein
MRYVVCAVGQYSSVGIANRYGLAGLRIESRWWKTFSATVETCPEAQQATYPMGIGSFSGVKRP